jgi:hypothetical protein
VDHPESTEGDPTGRRSRCSVVTFSGNGASAILDFKAAGACSSTQIAGLCECWREHVNGDDILSCTNGTHASEYHEWVLRSTEHNRFVEQRPGTFSLQEIHKVFLLAHIVCDAGDANEWIIEHHQLLAPRPR